MVMDLVPAGSDGTLDVLIGCLGAMSVLQARTLELAAEVEHHLAASARDQRELRADFEALTQRSLTTQPPEEPRQRLDQADAAGVDTLHQRLQAVETGIGMIVRQMIASYVVAEPDFGDRPEPPGDERIAGVQARLTVATAAVAQHRAHVASVRAAAHDRRASLNAAA